MRFGIKTAPQLCSWQELVDVWRAADEISLFESAWNFDHFYPLLEPKTGPCMEAWVTLSALAQATERIRVGCMVNGTPYRHPAVLANMAASLDLVSNGRLDLGLGAGWHQPECDAYGIELLPMKQRMDRFEEYVPVVISLLENETTDHEGHYFQLRNARCEPKGPQRPRPPIVIGGQGEKRTLRVVARYADHWNLPFATPEIFVAKNEVLLKHCAEVGRDPGEITRSVQIAMPAEQPPEEAAASAAALGEAGVDVVIFTIRNPYRASLVEPLARALEKVR